MVEAVDFDAEDGTDIVMELLHEEMELKQTVMALCNAYGEDDIHNTADGGHNGTVHEEFALTEEERIMFQERDMTINTAFDSILADLIEKLNS